MSFFRPFLGHFQIIYRSFLGRLYGHIQVVYWPHLSDIMVIFMSF